MFKKHTVILILASTWLIFCFNTNAISSTDSQYIEEYKRINYSSCFKESTSGSDAISPRLAKPFCICYVTKLTQTLQVTDLKKSEKNLSPYLNLIGKITGECAAEVIK